MKNGPIIVYVEDDAPSIVVMKAIMNHVLGIVDNLIVIENTSDFLEKVREIGSIPDIFLLDIHIQPYDGFELLKMIRSDNRLRYCKVVALTASVMNEEVEKLRESGFDGAISKPLDRYAFPKLIEKILDDQSVWHI
ncbi:MAG TPA: response regulator [Anaerolineales bacterium]|nr:response regulator [Anaerolineales bacterium]HMX18728.1 response regulator [Anaerolineales bacterium]HMX73777.1 response regulator [Anaerolineales bacterium]HMZ42135.1 response regulator [Anaerolineales bacterium]HNA54149.1 response regulator [Anaerolineales bacterium]